LEVGVPVAAGHDPDMTDDERLTELESQVIQEGWEVYSSDGERIGIVREVTADRFALALDVLPGNALAVPLDEIEAADDGRIELDIPAESVGVMGWDAWSDSSS
jgi:hypothetical protein